MKPWVGRKAVAFGIAFLLCLNFGILVAGEAEEPGESPSWSNPFDHNGYLYQTDGVTLFTTETDATFEIIISIDADHDGLFWPEDTDGDDHLYCHTDDGMNGNMVVDDGFINFAYYSITYRAGEPGNYGDNFKIWVNGSKFTGTNSQDGWCGHVGDVLQADGTYSAAQQTFTFPLGGGTFTQDVQIPGEGGNSTIITDVLPGSPSNNNTPTIHWSTNNGTQPDFYWSNDSGSTWHYWGTDTDDSSPWNSTSLPADDTYHFAVVADYVPVAPSDIDWGPWTLDADPPDVLSTDPFDGKSEHPLTSSAYIINFDEQMASSPSIFSTNLPNPIGSWTDSDTYSIDYDSLDSLTDYWINISGGFEDPASNIITEDVNFTFRTRDSTPPKTTIDYLTPGSGAGTTYNGHLPEEYVDVIATVNDTETGNNDIAGCEIRVQGIFNWTAMSPTSALDCPVEEFNYRIGLSLWPDDTEFTVECRGYDIDNIPDARPANATFSIDDSSEPVLSYLSPTPADGATIYNGIPAFIKIKYEDFTDNSSVVLYERDLGNATFDVHTMSFLQFQEGSRVCQWEQSIRRSYNSVVEYYILASDSAIPSMLYQSTPVRSVNFEFSVEEGPQNVRCSIIGSQINASDINITWDDCLDLSSTDTGAIMSSKPPMKPSSWSNPFGHDGYFYLTDGTTQFTSETDATFEMMISVDADGDGLYWPEATNGDDHLYVYTEDGMNGNTEIDDQYIYFAYYYLTYQAGDPGGHGVNFKIWVNGSNWSSVDSLNGWCGHVGDTPQANGQYTEAQQTFTFPASGGAFRQDVQIPGSGHSGYNVYCGTSPDTIDFSNPINSQLITDNWYVDAGAVNGSTEYYYSVRAVNLGVEGPNSATVGKYTMQFDAAYNAFGVPLDPFPEEVDPQGNVMSDYKLIDADSPYKIPYASTIYTYDNSKPGNIARTPTTPDFIPYEIIDPQRDGMMLYMDQAGQYTWTGWPAEQVLLSNSTTGLPAPTNFNISWQGDDLNVSWNAVAGANHYLIFTSNQRSLESYDFSSPEYVGTDTFYLDINSNITPGQKYYLVMALDSSGNIGNSTYSVGKYTHEYLQGWDRITTPFKSFRSHTCGSGHDLCDWLLVDDESPIAIPGMSTIYTYDYINKWVARAPTTPEFVTHRTIPLIGGCVQVYLDIENYYTWIS